MPNYEEIAIENPELLKAAKGIFGDLVVKVWEVRCPEYITVKGEKTGRKAFEAAIYPKVSGGHNSIGLNPGEVWIEFSNGRVVTFSTSEWGTLKLADQEGVLILDA